MASLSREEYEKNKPKSLCGTLEKTAIAGAKAPGRGVKHYARIIVKTKGKSSLKR